MTKYFKVSVKIVACYLIASIAYLLYSSWPHYEGHAHVPFSAFPEFLIWSPIAPYFLFQEFLASPSTAFFGLLVFCLAFSGTLWLFLRRKDNS
jgi:hypothetical protein